MSRNAYIASWPRRIAAASAALLAFLLVFQPQAWWWALFPLLLAPPAAFAGWLAWRGSGWYAKDGEWLLLRRGTFTLTSTAARIDRICYVNWAQGLLAGASSPLSLTIAVATSGKAGVLSPIFAILRAPANPSLVRLRNVGEPDARSMAISSGFAPSLPPSSIT